MARNILSLAILLLMISSCVILPAYADVDIDINMDGDVDIDVDQGNGNAVIDLDQNNGIAHITVNNIDVLAEWKSSQQSASSYLQMIYYLSARADVSDLEDDLEILEEDLYSLINQLNEILPFLEGRSIYTLKVIGVDHNSSDVVTNLESLEMSIADYLELHEVQLDEHTQKLVEIQEELDFIKGMIDNIEEEIIRLEEKVDDNSLSIALLAEGFVETTALMAEDTEGKFIVLGSLSAGTIVMLLTLVYLQGMEYMRLKKRIDTLTDE